MKDSSAVGNGLSAFYAAFNTGDADRFEQALAHGPGVSVIGTAPGEGHQSREDWVRAYREGIAEMGLQLRGGTASAWEHGDVGWAVDTPSFVMPDGSTLPTRLTAVLCREEATWRIAHLHFSVGVPDEEAIQPPGQEA